MDFLDQLNPEQREAVLRVEGPLLILAGAGSGKTRVIAYRIAYLIGGGHAHPTEVVALTFTNKAAEEMRGRVSSLLGDACEGAWVMTFHAMCARLLRREAPNVGLSRDFVIYDSSDQVSAVKQVMRTLNIDDGVLQPRSVLSRISHAKNQMQAPDAFLNSHNPRDAELGKIYEGYQAALAASNAVDFDDLLLKTLQLFDQDVAQGRPGGLPHADVRGSADMRRKYARRFKFLLVDEYQDTNRPQYLLLKRMAEAHRNICVVGDPDQSIYKWRGADIHNILDFERDYPEAFVVKLERNYRSTQVILDAASAVIRQNRERKEKRLYTEQAGGDKLLYHQSNDELEEADFIARTARRLAHSPAQSPMAVLYRTNAQSRVIEDAMRREGIPYRIIGSVRFYERREVKDALSYLKLLLNPDDDVSLRRVINVPTRGIGKGVMDALAAAPPAAERPDLAEARSAKAGAPTVITDATLITDDATVAAGLRARDTQPSSTSLWARLVSGLETGAFTGRAASSLRAFRDLMVGLGEVARTEPVSILLGKVLDRTGYLNELREERTQEAEGRIDNLMELVSAAKEYEARNGNGDASLGGFVDQLSLLSDADESEGSADARVLMMTLHSAKGLEFPVVVIAGLEESLFPHSRSADDEAELEEERRLCYVGMTRARRKLLLTGAMRRRWYGEYRAQSPSRFLEEIPQELVDLDIGGTPPLYQPAFSSVERRQGPYRRGTGPTRVREEAAAYAYEDEDQSSPGHLEVGARVRHAKFGLGTVVSLQAVGGDTKLVVRFASVGSKTLLAKFANLQVV